MNTERKIWKLELLSIQVNQHPIETNKFIRNIVQVLSMGWERKHTKQIVNLMEEALKAVQTIMEQTLKYRCFLV